MVLDKSKKLPQTLIWHNVHAKATGDIQAPHVCPSRGFSSPPALIWLLVPSGLLCQRGKHTVSGFTAKGSSDGILPHVAKSWVLISVCGEESGHRV